MQNFSNSPATLPPGFPSRGGNLVGSPYPPHISDPQISPRTIEDYAAMQQSQSILQSHGQHPHLRGQQHPGQASHIHGYGSRRSAGDIPQPTGSSSSSYRKESMDYYFSVSGRDRNRRGGGGFAAGFGYTNMEYQYRHVSGSGPSSSLMSPYPMDYSASAATGSGSGNSNSSGSGSFSPTQQFSMAQNTSMQPVSSADMHQRQHQKYPSHQGLHQGHRTYPLSGHRIPSHFGHYSPLNVPAASVGMYNSPPQRYEMSSGNMDSKINSPTHTNPNTTAASNNSGHQENAGQSYTSTNHPPYSPQSHPVPKHGSRRTPQHNLGASYDGQLKMQHAPPGLAHSKNHQSSVSLSPAAPHHASQDISKSPMQSQNQQTPMNQNFSPISNPSPVPSAVHSPSCSSSSSPLMGVSEGLGSSASLHSSLLNPRISHSHIRSQHTLSQLSPTPSSNSSISSCGSVVSSAVNQNRMGVGLLGGQREESSSSLYAQDKLSQDPGLNSLNALTSQVANLPNTVQHTLLTDTVLSQKKRKDSTHHPPLQQTVNNQQKHRNTSSAGRSTNEESGDVLTSESDEISKNHSDHPGHEKIRQPEGFSTESNPTNYYSATPIQTQTQTGQSCPARHLQMDDRVMDASVKQSFSQGEKPFSEIKPPETQTSSSSSSPPCVPPETSPNATSCVPAPSASSSAASSPSHSVHSNCVTEPDLSQNYEKSVLKEKNTTSDMKDEKNTVKDEESSHHELDCGKNTQTLASVKVEQSGPVEQNENKKDDKKNIAQHLLCRTLNTAEQSNVGVGVIVSTRSEQSPEEIKQTEVTSHHSSSSDMAKLSYPEEKHSINMFRTSGNHNGDGDTGMETFTAHFDVSPKTEFGQNVPSNHCQSGSYKYCNPEMPYNACMGAKIKARDGPGSGMVANRYQDYHQSQSNFGYVSRKDIGVLGVLAKGGMGSRSQDNNSQLQQPYPSLLQEVLQGYHLDRRYCHPEQTSGSPHQPQNMSQHHYHTRLPYRMTENMRTHGMDQTAISGAGIHQQMAPGKHQSQNQGTGHEMALGLLHPSWDSEAQRPKGDQGISSEKGTITMSPNHSTLIQRSLDHSPVTPPKHINLADYTLPQRKTPSLATPPSAVQQLLLQESDQELSRNAESMNQTQSQMSLAAERRSVICDVSPSRRTTSEKDRSHCGTSGSSVIQQPLSSSVLSDQGCTKEDVKDKRHEMEKSSKTNPKELGKTIGDGHSAILPKEEPIKSIHIAMEVNSDLRRQSGGKGISDPSSNALYHSKISSNPLSSPPRCKPYSQAIDGSSASFPVYGFSDTADGTKINAHHPSPNSFHSLSSPSHVPPSVKKLQAYTHHVPLQHPHGLSDRFDWSISSRHKDVSILHNSTQNPDQKLSRQHSYPGTHYDMKMWESYTEREGNGNQQLHSLAPSQKSTGSVPTSGPKSLEVDVYRVTAEDSAKSFHPPAVAGSGVSGSSIITLSVPQGHRQSKTGGSAETNPLMMRRRVRSFISPIPAKRQHHDFSGNRGVSSHHSPVAHSESKPLNDSDSSVDSRPKLALPSTAFHTPSANSPPQAKTKFLPPRKGRGLKLEAIVQKITPNKKVSYSNSHTDADYSDASHYNPDLPDPEIGAHFSNAPHRESGCLPFLDEAHSLDDLLPYRAEDAYSCDSQVLKQGVTGSAGTSLRNLPTDFDFVLGTAGSSGPGTEEGDKDEFTLLGPLPPPPPLPRPVQGSPPPSSSALSDIQQFTNTYQQLETRRGEQSAANLLRQKLQETGMGFDDYPGGDFYGATPPHGQSPGHHLLSRPSTCELSSPRAAASDSKLQESFVPKGYFPSGKKKGRPVGSVNKQKRAQVQVQSSTSNVTSAPLTPPAGSLSATPQPASNSSMAGDTVVSSNIAEPKTCLTPDLVTPSQPVKVEIEGEDNQPEVDMKPIKHRQRKGKEGNEGTGSKSRQWRKSRGMTSKEELDPQTIGVGNAGTLQDIRKNIFSPYVHVERKITEIGAVCTVVNSEDEKSKGGKTCGSVVDSTSNVSLISQMVRKEREIERMQEKGIDEQNDSVIQSGKSLPTSGYVLPGPVSSETGHTGRLLCCLCQKWANYKNLGDLYGPFYPADYAAKLPKNQPQVRQILSNTGAANAGSNPSSVSTELTVPDIQSVYLPDISSADTSCSVSQITNPVSPAMSENLPCLSTTTKAPEQNWNVMQEGALITLDPPELENELTQRRQQKADDVQPRPQHRKLTSHPRFKRRHKSSEDLPRTIPINSKASLPFQPPPPSLDSLGPLAQLAQLPVVPLDPNELWVHESCIVWTSGIYLVNGKLYGLQEALDGARETSCSHCEMPGSTLGCYSKGCTLRYHFLCAVEADCYLNEDNFSLRCPKHKFPQNSRPAKPAAALQEQSERG